MKPLSKSEKQELKKLIDDDVPLSESWSQRLFPARSQAQVGKEYRLMYDGKLTREEVLAETPAAPWQLVRSFCDDRPHKDGWQNLLVWGDNLLALRELLADQRGPNHFGTRDKIKLVYIDPPFATRQDFMQDKEKAYRDKVLGAKFIEFLRRRLILLRELLADDGNLFVHLDIKKSHYLKALLDEVFGEENFQNEIVWKRTSARSDSHTFNHIHDTIFFYSKTSSFKYYEQFLAHGAAYIDRYFTQQESDGRRFATIDATQSGLRKGPSGESWRGFAPGNKGNHWKFQPSELDRLDREGRIYWPQKEGGWPRLKAYLDEQKGAAIQSIWTDIKAVNSQASERIAYPTQKPEPLVERIIRSASAEDDIVLDCFAGSGTTAAVAEKLGRRWISIDSGKLAIYTTQRRLFCLTTQVGSAKKDERAQTERVEDWSDHEKRSRAIFFITEKARKGECDVTLGLLQDIAEVAEKHRLVRADTPLSIVCPESKLKFDSGQLFEPADAPGTLGIFVGGIEFRISFIQPKDKAEKERPLSAKQFALYRAGIYDMHQIQGMPWDSYRPLVMKLFGVRDAPHSRYGFDMDGYVRSDSAVVWNYPNHPSITLDHEYVRDLHKLLRGKNDERIYVIAPVIAMAFMEDEVTIGRTTYVFLKVPVSVLMRLIEAGAPAALPQPVRENDVNEVIDAVGFDFISQPLIAWSLRKSAPTDGLLKSFIIEITEFRAQTLATDPEDFANFETLSMVMVDLDYDEDVFRLSEVYWGENLVEEAGGLQEAKSLTISIPEESFVGDRLMMILCDRYGNEKALAIAKSEFRSIKQKANATKPIKKKAAKRRPAGGSR